MKQNARCVRWIALVACTLMASPAAPDDAVYQIVYGATLDPAAHRAEVRIAVRHFVLSLEERETRTHERVRTRPGILRREAGVRVERR